MPNSTLRSPTPALQAEAVSFIRKLSPPVIIEYIKDGLYRGLDIGYPVDVILDIYSGAGDLFGSDVLATIFERDSILRPPYARLLRFLSLYCTNPDPTRWAVFMLRDAAREVLIRKLHRLQVVPETLEKPALRSTPDAGPAKAAPKPPAKVKPGVLPAVP